jgi:hypothetical protein
VVSVLEEFFKGLTKQELREELRRDIHEHMDSFMQN